MSGSSLFGEHSTAVQEPVLWAGVSDKWLSTTLYLNVTMNPAGFLQLYISSKLRNFEINRKENTIICMYTKKL